LLILTQLQPSPGERLPIILSAVIPKTAGQSIDVKSIKLAWNVTKTFTSPMTVDCGGYLPSQNSHFMATAYSVLYSAVLLVFPLQEAGCLWP